MITATGALEKMTILSFDDDKNTIPSKSFRAMYNPSTFSLNHSNSYDSKETPTTGTSDQKFLKRNPSSLTVELFFDGTGASPASLHPGVNLGTNAPSLPNEPVNIQIENFLTVAYRIKKDEHRSPFLLFVWGTFIFPCVLESANVSYSLFNSNGVPLRAKISISAKEHVNASKLNLELRLSSPDLTQSRTVLAGDTLPNLAQKMYKDESLYMELARVNNLHNYRKLKPGMQLIFPPIEKIKTKA